MKISFITNSVFHHDDSHIDKLGFYYIIYVRCICAVCVLYQCLVLWAKTTVACTSTQHKTPPAIGVAELPMQHNCYGAILLLHVCRFYMSRYSSILQCYYMYEVSSIYVFIVTVVSLIKGCR